MSWWAASCVAAPWPCSSWARKKYCANLPPANGSKNSCGVVEVRAELAHDLVGLVAQVRVLLPGQRARRLQHGAVGALGGAAELASRRAAAAPRRPRARPRPARTRRRARPRRRTRPRPCRRWCTRAGRPSRCRSSGPARSVGSTCSSSTMRADRLLADAVDEGLEASRPSWRSCAYMLGEALDDLGHALRRDGADGQAVGAARCCVHWPPITSWKCGTRRPLTLRLTPQKPMSATWCWPQELKQPLVLMCRSLDASSSWSMPDGRAAAGAARPASAARRRDAELAGVGARAGGDVGDGAGAGLARGRSPSAPA